MTKWTNADDFVQHHKSIGNTVEQTFTGYLAFDADGWMVDEYDAFDVLRNAVRDFVRVVFGGKPQ